MKTYGTIQYVEGDWRINCEPHVSMMFKRVMKSIPRFGGGDLILPTDNETSHTIRWILDRYPMAGDVEELDRRAKLHEEHIETLHSLLEGSYTPGVYSLAVPPREYQVKAADWWLATKGGLLADDVGVGKTCSVICGLASGQPMPCLVVCPKHLLLQWKREIQRFLPALKVHVIKKGSPYALKDRHGNLPDVVICSYTMLRGWPKVLGEYCKGIVFDEVHELRRGDSDKYRAAKSIASRLPYRIGLSATPIFNYGNEIWNVMEVLCPGRLGDFHEFSREWLTASYNNFTDADAFRSYLVSNYMMLRRTRKDVNRELPAVSSITIEVESDSEAIQKISGKAGELARLILSPEKQVNGNKMQASGELDALIRQATGVAKAPYVAAFVEMLIQNGESVVLFGWHHAVYAIWKDLLREYNPVFYTGEETIHQKQKSLEEFKAGRSKVFIMSLRAGAGVDGLQHCCRTVVYGELDWSPAVHRQGTGRVARDGQQDPVTAYFAVSDDGADPIMARILGLKDAQVRGLIGDKQDELEMRIDGVDHLRELAQRYLKAGESHD